MSQFTLQFTTNSPEFDDFPQTQLAAILRGLADKLDHGYDEGIVRDVNGNRIGTYTYQRNVPDITDSDEGGPDDD